jgi:hypothetical protein
VVVAPPYEPDEPKCIRCGKGALPTGGPRERPDRGTGMGDRSPGRGGGGGWTPRNQIEAAGVAMLVAPVAVVAGVEAACAAAAFEASSAAISMGVRLMSLPGGAAVYSALTGTTWPGARNRVEAVMRGNAPLESLTISERVIGIYTYAKVVANPQNKEWWYAQYYNIARINFLKGEGPIPPPNLPAFKPLLERTWPFCPK